MPTKEPAEGKHMETTQEQIIDLLHKSPMGIPEMADAMFESRRVSRSSMRTTLTRHLRIMYQDGILDRSGRGTTTSPYVYSLKEHLE